MIRPPSSKPLADRSWTSTTRAFLKTMEEYAAIGVDLIEVTPRADDPAKWIADFASQVVSTMAELGR